MLPIPTKTNFKQPKSKRKKEIKYYVFVKSKRKRKEFKMSLREEIKKILQLFGGLVQYHINCNQIKDKLLEDTLTQILELVKKERISKEEIAQVIMGEEIWGLVASKYGVDIAEKARFKLANVIYKLINKE